MKKAHFTESQIVSVLKLADSGMKIDKIFRQNGINNATHYNWKSKYGGMEAAEDENARLKKLFAEVSQEKHAMKEHFAKKGR